MTEFEKIVAKLGALPVAFRISTPEGKQDFGEGAPVFEIVVRNERGRRALLAMNQLVLIEAYMRDDIDIEGDIVKAVSFETQISDRATWLKIWRRLKPLLVGRERCNPEWIAKHYDSGNVQLIAADMIWNTYTPGIYESKDDSLEAGAERKLKFAYDSLRLRPGDSLLEIGCGWGGFMRFCARKGITPTGITLSQDQFNFTRRQLKDDKLDGEVLYQDFFSFDPGRQFDAINVMGVMEDISNYRSFLRRVQNWVKPGGRIYFDFATESTPFSTAAFITKYIWPGTFRKVYMPEFVKAVWESPFEIAALYNDRRNYWLWGEKLLERWQERRADVLALSNEETWRMFRILYAATAHIMSHPSYDASAMRVVLELPGPNPIRA